MNAATITPGMLIARTRTESAYATVRDFNEIGQTIRSTSVLVGKREVSDLFTVVRTRRSKRGLRVLVSDMYDSMCTLVISAENEGELSVCEPIPS